MSLIVRDTPGGVTVMAHADVCKSSCPLRMGEEVSISGLNTTSLNGQRAWVVTDTQKSSTGVRYGVWLGPGHPPIRVKRENLLPICNREWPTRLTVGPSGSTQRISVSVASLICQESASVVKTQFNDYLEGPLRALLQRTQCSEHFDGSVFHGALDVPKWLSVRLRTVMWDFGFWYLQREVMGAFEPHLRWKVHKWYGAHDAEPVLSVEVNSLKELRRMFTRILRSEYDHRDSAAHNLLVQPLHVAMNKWRLPDHILDAVEKGVDAKTQMYTVPVVVCLTLEDFQRTDLTDMFWSAHVCYIPERYSRAERQLMEGSESWGKWTHAHGQLQAIKEDQRDLLQEEAADAYDPRFLRNAGVCSCCQQSRGLDDMLKCGGCDVAIYCNQKHQKEHWKTHKAFCPRFRLLRTEEVLSGLHIDDLTTRLFPARAKVEVCE